MTPRRLDLKRDDRLRIEWPDGEGSISVTDLRRLCPCAACKMAREGKDPHQLFGPATGAAKPAKRSLKLGVIPAALAAGPRVAVERAEAVGNYALRLHFTDGHQSGIYSWAYLRELAPPAE